MPMTAMPIGAALPWPYPDMPIFVNLILKGSVWFIFTWPELYLILDVKKLEFLIYLTERFVLSTITDFAISLLRLPG
jgi:hypothetical protein